MTVTVVLIVVLFGAEPRSFTMPDEETFWTQAKAIRAASRLDRPNGAACVFERARA
jgi:hypothetical protein